MTSHHTDLAGSEIVIDEALDDFAHILLEQRIASAGDIAHSEQARNIFVNLFAATRREERRALELMASMVGEQVAHSVLVRALLQRVKRDAVAPPRSLGARPLPRGVTPVGTGPDDTTPIHSPRPVLEGSIPPDERAPTTQLPPLKPHNAIGPWGESLPPTRPVKPRRR